MKTQILRFCLVVSCLFAYVFPVKALEWWEKVEYLTYSPRYFGPNAFPIPSTIITKKRGINSKPIAKLQMSAAFEERASIEINIPIVA